MPGTAADQPPTLRPGSLPAASTAGSLTFEKRKACPRELRHTFVSLMSDSGVPVEEIARLAGHASSRTTELVYRHQLRPIMEKGAETTDRLFTGAA